MICDVNYVPVAT